MFCVFFNDDWDCALPCGDDLMCDYEPISIAAPLGCKRAHLFPQTTLHMHAAFCDMCRHQGHFCIFWLWNVLSDGSMVLNWTSWRRPIETIESMNTNHHWHFKLNGDNSSKEKWAMNAHHGYPKLIMTGTRVHLCSNHNEQMTLGNFEEVHRLSSWICWSLTWFYVDDDDALI